MATVAIKNEKIESVESRDYRLFMKSYNETIERLKNPQHSNYEDYVFFQQIVNPDSVMTFFLLWKDRTHNGSPSSGELFQKFVIVTVQNRTIRISRNAGSLGETYLAQVVGNTPNAWGEDKVLDVLEHLHNHVELKRPITTDDIKYLRLLDVLSSESKDVIQSSFNERLLNYKVRINIDSSISPDEIW